MWQLGHADWTSNATRDCFVQCVYCWIGGSPRAIAETLRFPPLTMWLRYSNLNRHTHVYPRGSTSDMDENNCEVNRTDVRSKPSLSVLHSFFHGKMHVCGYGSADSLQALQASWHSLLS